MNDTPEPQTRLVNMNHLGRALLEYDDPPVDMLFVYNCNPLATMPDQNRVLEGLEREDLFTVVFDQVFTDTARYADVILPATTFLENYDIAKAYGPISLQLVRPAIEPVGEARPNPEVFSDLAERLGVGEAEEEIETLLRIAGRLPRAARRRADGTRLRDAALRRGAGAVRRRVPADAGRQGRTSFRRSSTARRPAGSTRYQPRSRRPSRYPLALISPASEKTVSSTLGELRERAAMLQMHPPRRRGARARRRTIRCASSTTSARCTAGRRQPGHVARAPCRSRKGCGGRAPTTARPRTRWCPTR